MPEADRLAEALALVGSDKMILEPRAKTVRLTQPGMKLDLGGLAKGYAADEALRVLKANGVTRAGRRCRRHRRGRSPPGRTGWTIGVAALNPGKDKPRRYLAATTPPSPQPATPSSSSRSTASGTPTSSTRGPAWASSIVAHVTVFARDGLTADSLDTAIYRPRPRPWPPLVESTEGAAALIVRLTPQGEETLESKRWSQLPRHSRRLMKNRFFPAA